MIASVDTAPPATTVARFVARLTFASSTPSSLRRYRSIRFTQDAQAMPSTSRVRRRGASRASSTDRDGGVALMLEMILPGGIQRGRGAPGGVAGCAAAEGSSDAILVAGRSSEAGSCGG